MNWLICSQFASGWERCFSSCGTGGTCEPIQRENLIAKWTPYYVYGRAYVYLWSVLLTASSMFVATQLWGRVDQNFALRQHKDTGWLASSSEALPALKEHPFAGELPVWLQPRWFAFLLVAINAWLIFVCFW